MRRHLRGRLSQHHRGVVDIRIPLVLMFKDPTTGFDLHRILVIPIPSKTNFLTDQPFRGSDEGRVILGDPGLPEADAGNRGVPDRREAGFDPYGGLGFVLKILKLSFRPLYLWVIIRVTQCLQGYQRIEHGREDGGQTIGSFEPFKHPGFRSFKRPPAKWVQAVLGEPLGESVESIEINEKITPSDPLGVAPERQVPFVEASSYVCVVYM